MVHLQHRCRWCPSLSTLLLSALLFFVAAPAAADEGMWLFNDPPLDRLSEQYGVELEPGWLEHLQKSSVRFNNGGSGSFVSSEGLVLTNHHVGSDAIQKLSTPDRDLIADGFLAGSRQEELPTKDLELNVLVSIEDVTERVKSAAAPDLSPEETEAARQAVIAEIEQSSLEETGLRSDVVTLFRGGAYHLYRYRRYTDVRLVFAPELDIAFYGGDTDNFEYPRTCLDMALFRVYEDGAPLATEHFLRPASEGLEDGDLTFVSGHPGRTERLNTRAHLEYLRDVRYPMALQGIRRAEVLLRVYSERSPENKRQAHDELFSYQNSRKAYLGGLDGLQNPELIAAKRAHEASIKAALVGDRELAQRYGNPHQEIAEALAVQREIAMDHYLLESGRAFNSELFDLARTLLRGRTERERPNGERLREFRESNLESLEQELFSEAPIYKDLEVEKLADSLAMLAEIRGADDPLVALVLAGQSPRSRAQSLIRETRLDSVEARRALWEGRATESDPMIDLARLVDREARELRARLENEVSGPMQQAYGRLAQLEHELGLTPGYPDATFTLRLAYGPVAGYQADGQEIAPFTTFADLYRKGEEFQQQPPYTVPERWLDAKERLDLSTPFNFVSTPDITGGNSGSPVVNRDGRLVGLIFDGNIESLVLDFAYEDTVARAVSVDLQAMLEALDKVYGAAELLDELTRQ